MGLKQLGFSLAAFVLGAGLAITPALAADKAQSFTGEVGDAMCGTKHQMEGNPAECTAACVAHGSKYALIVGEKVYILEADQKAQDALAKLAGAKATVTGTADGNTIQVASVTPKK
jgi:hypothetical protein